MSLLHKFDSYTESVLCEYFMLDIKHGKKKIKVNKVTTTPARMDDVNSLAKCII